MLENKFEFPRTGGEKNKGREEGPAEEQQEAPEEQTPASTLEGEKGERSEEEVKNKEEEDLQRTKRILESAGGLPSQYVRAKYSSLESPTYEDFVNQNKEKEEFSPEFIKKMRPLIVESSRKRQEKEHQESEELTKMIDDFSRQQESSRRYENIEKIKEWLGNSSFDEETQLNIENKLATLFKKKKDLDSYDLLLLGELQQYNDVVFASEEIVKTLEDHFSTADNLSLMDEMAVLNRANTEQSNLCMNKMLDYLRSHLKTLQNQPPDKELENDFFVRFYKDFLEREKELSKNYIVKKNMENLSETFDILSAERYKKDIVSGISGGTDDREIYVYSHQLNSYYNKLALGVNEGYVLGEPLYQVAPGYYGLYKGDNLEKIYTCDTNDPEQEAKKIEQFYIDETNDGSEEIYNEINSPPSFFGVNQYADDSYKMHKLEDIWRFEEEKDGDFFYDLSQINIEDLHPMVLAHLLTQNYKYIQQREGFKEENHRQVEQEEFYHQLQPLGEYSEDEFYEYKQLNKLNIRKALQDDFNINIEECDLWTQRNFLEYLKTRDVEEAESLQRFTSQYGQEGLKTFISLESGEEMGGVILELGKRLEDTPKVASELFGKYAEMVDRMDEMAEEAAEMYEEVFFEREVDKDKVKQNLLQKANNLLQRAEQELKSEGGEADKEKIIKEIVNDLEREDKVQREEMNKIKELLEQLSGEYKEINAEFFENIPDIKKETYKNDEGHSDDIEDIEAEGESEVESEDDMEDVEDLDYDDFQNWLNETKKETKRLYNYDSNKLQNLIDFYSSLYGQTENNALISDREQLIIEGFSEEEAEKKIENERQQLLERFEPFVKKLEKILPLQQNLETQLDQFVYGITDLDKEEQNVADQVFSRYRELVDQASRNKKEIKELFKEEKNISEEEIEKISENTLSKARALLEDFSQKIIQGEELDEQEVMQELENYNSDLLFTASVMKALKKEYGRADVDIENLEGVTFEEKTISDLVGDEETKEAVERIYEEEVKETPEIPSSSIEDILRQTAENFGKREGENIKEIKRMMDIYKENYKEFPALQAKLLKGFTELLTKEDTSTTLYTLKKENELLAFCRFTDLGEGKKEFGAFNVPESLHDSAIGSSFLKSTLEKEAEENDIYAECDSSSPISGYYINGNKGKFIVDKVNIDYGGTGKNIFSISRPRQEQEEQKEYSYHRLSRKEIIQEYENNVGENRPDSGESSLLVKYEKDSEEFFDTASRLVNEQGYVITNYVLDEENGLVYAAFERG